MTQQERTLTWVGVAVFAAIALVAEYVLAPGGIAKPIIILICVVLIGYAIYQSSRPRRRRHRD